MKLLLLCGVSLLELLPLYFELLHQTQKVRLTALIKRMLLLEVV